MTLPFASWVRFLFLRLEKKSEWEKIWISEVKVTQSCLTLCDPMDYTVHGILQARILEWTAFPFSRGSSWLRDWTGIYCIAGRFFTNWDMREASVGEEVSKSKPKYIWTNKKWIKRETINRNSGNCLPNKCKFVIAEIDIKIMVFTWGQKVRAFFFQ